MNLSVCPRSMVTVSALCVHYERANPAFLPGVVPTKLRRPSAHKPGSVNMWWTDGQMFSNSPKSKPGSPPCVWGLPQRHVDAVGWAVSPRVGFHLLQLGFPALTAPLPNTVLRCFGDRGDQKWVSRQPSLGGAPSTPRCVTGVVRPPRCWPDQLLRAVSGRSSHPRLLFC